MTISSEQHDAGATLQGLLSSNPEEVNKAVMLIYEKYYPGISSYLLKRGMSNSDTQDIFQDGILTLLNSLKKGKIKPQSNIGGYFFTICKHLGMKKGTKDSRMHLESIEYDTFNQMPDDWNTMDEDEERNKLRLKSWKLMDSLGKPCADLLKKSFSGNQKIVNFFSELGYKNAQVARTAKYKCLKRLRAKLEKDPEAKQLIKTLFS